MKTSVLLTALLILCGLYTHAQDVIVKNDKSELQVKVEEITSNTVRFRYASRPDGPMYNLDKSEVFLIIYKDGSRESFTSQAPVPGNNLAPKTEQANQQPTPSADAAPPIPEPGSDRRSGWSYGIGYMTSTAAFAQVHGYTVTTGYYTRLGQKRNTALLFDFAGLDYFQKNAPTYYSLTGNALFRFGSASSVYAGLGLGYGALFVRYPDGYSTRTTSYGDLCGSLFLGVGSLRAGVMLPSLGTAGGGMFTFGFYTNPFK